MEKTNIHIVNKRASYEYHILQKYTAGIQLFGTEIKSIRAGNVNISDAFCFFKAETKGGVEELYIRNMNIGSFKQGSYNNHEPMRIRKLLLKRPELRKLRTKASEKGLAIVPLKMFISDTGYAKIEIAIGQGRKASTNARTSKPVMYKGTCNAKRCSRPRITTRRFSCSSAVPPR